MRPWTMPLLLCAFAAGAQSDTLTVVTYNIRYDNQADGPDRWDLRKEALAGVVKDVRPALIGLQEGLAHQLTYLDAQWPGHARFGVGREDGDRQGEFSPIYYSGLFAILNIDFGASTITPQSFIGQVNAQTGLTGITAMTTAQASDAQQTSFFNEWLPGDLQASIVFKWTPLNPPTSPGLSQIFTFAWDLNDATAFNNGLSLNGAYGVPTPGALALLGLAGFVGRRRSR